MKNFNDLKVGDKVKCINEEGWDTFKNGCVYTVTEDWHRGIDLDGIPVSQSFSADFEKVNED